MKRRSTCDMLRPCLVALVYDEPHPETARLLDHLEECAGCRHEQSDLRQTRLWIDVSLQAPGTLGEAVSRRAAGRRRAGALLGAVPLVVAAAALVVMLLAEGPRKGDAPQRGVLEIAGLAVGAGSLSYGGEEIDVWIVQSEAEIRRLEDAGDDPW